MSGVGWRKASRRAVLRGAGVALTLPWLESLVSREANAQAGSPKLRFLPIYLPNGASDNWKPTTAGANGNWALSPVLDELAPLKPRVTVLSGLENGSVFNANGSASVEPAHGRQPGAWLTCADALEVRQRLGLPNAPDVNGVSVDQVLAAHPSSWGPTALASLQLGLATSSSNCDGMPCSLGRSVSWRTETEPLYKRVDPTEVFETLVNALMPSVPDAAGLKRKAERKSVLDAVLESAALVQPKLSSRDSQRLDEFFVSVRDLEQRLEQPIDLSPALQNPTPAGFPSLRNGDAQYLKNQGNYDRRVHADLMNDLIVLAFQTDATRVISYMLDDEYSEFSYDFLPIRQFTSTGSIETAELCGTYSSAQHGSQDHYASLTRWHVGRVASLCQRLANVFEEDGRSVLDNSVVFLGSGMHGSDHACADLPALFVGGGGGRLRTDQHLAFDRRPLRDFYFTLLNGVYQLGVSDFGASRSGDPIATISELLLT